MGEKKREITVLIADDDEGYRFLLVSILSDFNYKVLEAENVEDVKKQSKLAQLWVVDVRLPSSNLEGIEIVRELSIKHCKPNYDVIFISVLSEEDCKPKLDNFPLKYIWIEKPFEPEYLLHTIDEITGRKKNES